MYRIIWLIRDKRSSLKYKSICKKTCTMYIHPNLRKYIRRLQLQNVCIAALVLFKSITYIHEVFSCHFMSVTVAQAISLVRRLFNYHAVFDSWCFKRVMIFWSRFTVRPYQLTINLMFEISRIMNTEKLCEWHLMPELSLRLSLRARKV